MTRSPSAPSHSAQVSFFCEDCPRHLRSTRCSLFDLPGVPTATRSWSHLKEGGGEKNLYPLRHFPTTFCPFCLLTSVLCYSAPSPAIWAQHRLSGWRGGQNNAPHFAMMDSSSPPSAAINSGEAQAACRHTPIESPQPAGWGPRTPVPPKPRGVPEQAG
ncbi:hypothetical protein NDU88_004350 [Pleurodeles waltl]|uniref:Uncharacterized protein n=1 Tax=Pleurodeles waltl TaxID=8319 RepID=A0AAV7VGU3_PLEWA|nr:hypothetical protein NDU88_004350 [Pleurodeles waltl]